MIVRTGWLVAGGVLALAAGFVAGRGWSRAPLAATNELVPDGQWRRMPGGPIARYEPGAVVVGGKLFAFGGFKNKRIEATPKVDVWDTASRSWVARKDMPIPTTHWMPVRVGDTLWFAGGYTGDHPGPGTNRVWAYDMTRDSWHEGPSLPAVRGGGLLVVVDSALHYITGYGEDRQHALADHWRLDLRRLGSGARWEPRARLPRPRGHASGAVLGGYIYLIGGVIRHDPVQVDVALVDRYDVARDRWEVVADLPKARSHTEAATFVEDGLIYVAGGRSLPTGERSVGDLVVYDPAANQWFFDRRLPVGLLAPIALPIGDSLILGLGATEGVGLDSARFWSAPLRWERLRGASLPIAIDEAAAGVIGNRLYLVGRAADSTIHRYHLGTNEWEPPVARRPALGYSHTAEVHGNRLYLLGGSLRALGVLQIFDPSTDQWNFGADLPIRAAGSASAAIDGQLFVGGGIDRKVAIGTAARYDPGSDQWATVASMPLVRGFAASGTDGRRWYVFGGRGPGNAPGDSLASAVFDQVQVYDPASDRWIVSGRDPAAPAPMPEARTDLGRAVYANGEFWVIGGGTTATGDSASARIDIFDPVANRWRRGPDLSVPRRGAFPLLVGRRIYIVGGRTPGGGPRSNELEIIDPTRFPPPN